MVASRSSPWTTRWLTAPTSWTGRSGSWTSSRLTKGSSGSCSMVRLPNSSGNTAELGVTQRGVEDERLLQIRDPKPEVQHAHARQISPTTPREVDALISRSTTDGHPRFATSADLARVAGRSLLLLALPWQYFASCI